MIALNPDLRLIKPNARTLNLETTMRGRERIANTMRVLGNNIRTFRLNFEPMCAEWVEVYKNGRRVIGGYTVDGRQLSFNPPLSGRIDVICDNDDPTNLEWLEIPIANLIHADNVVESAEGTDRRVGEGEPNIAQYCYPIVIQQPIAGFCRPSVYRDKLLYCPMLGYLGPDAITYAIMNDSGQMSDAKCINILVKEKEPEVPPEEETDGATTEV